MAPRELPEAVRSLITRQIGSVLELDVLLAMRTGGPTTATVVARQLRLNDEAVAAALDKFAAAGLVAREADTYAYRPRGEKLAQAVEQLADCYSRRRVTVVGFIYNRPSEGVSAFADAFRLRKDD